LPLTEHQARLAHPSADGVNGLAATCSIEAAATRFAIERDVLLSPNLQAQDKQRSPRAKHTREAFGVECTKHSEKQLLSRRPVWHVQKGGKPVGIGFSPQAIASASSQLQTIAIKAVTTTIRRG
jgi:hypothetical protein